jgi:hypothetical protein
MKPTGAAPASAGTSILSVFSAWTVKAKLIVSFGAPLHFSAGEMFWPSQPKPLNNWASVSVLRGLMVGLARVKPVARASDAAPSVAAKARVYGWDMDVVAS